MKLWLSLLGIALACVVMAGCGGGASAGAPPDVSKASPPRSIDLTGLNAVQAGIARLALQPSYRATVVSDTTGGDKITGSFEFATPDRYHLTVAGGIPVEVITVGRDSYVKSGGRWQEAEPTALPFSPADVMSELQDIAQAAGEPAGQRDVSGSPCTVYVIPRESGDAEFCVESGGSLRSASFKDGATSLSVTFGDFDSQIEIKAPI